MHPLGSPSSRASLSGVTPTPPPWSLRTKLYVFVASLNPINGEDPVLQGLPAGSYNPSETLHPSALALVNGAPQWKRGRAIVVLARYQTSPIGPYDELMMIVKGFANPYQKGTGGRVTNIFVSTRESVRNGRYNWNIPKHLARFEFVPLGSMTSNVKVFLPDAEKPFFTASLTDSSLPGIPLPPSVVAHFTSLVQPPILSGLPEDIQVASDDEWLSVSTHYNGRWQLAYIRPSATDCAKYGDGLHFPQIAPFWIGARFTGTVIVPEGTQLRKKVD